MYDNILPKDGEQNNLPDIFTLMFLFFFRAQPLESGEGASFASLLFFVSYFKY